MPGTTKGGGGVRTGAFSIGGELDKGEETKLEASSTLGCEGKENQEGWQAAPELCLERTGNDLLEANGLGEVCNVKEEIGDVKGCGRQKPAIGTSWLTV
jgi:hypothetical protein